MIERKPAILLGERAIEGLLARVERFDDLARQAEHQRMRRDFRAGRYDRAGSNNAAMTHHCAVQNRRLHSNQHAAFNRAAVQHRSMANDNILHDNRRIVVA